MPHIVSHLRSKSAVVALCAAALVPAAAMAQEEVGPASSSGGAVAGDSSVPAASSGKLTRILDKIAECESGGDPTAVSRGGTYRGKYQFHRSTWKSLGGKGDPAKAREAEQDKRARVLYRREGWKPWPVCGKKVVRSS